MSGTGDAVPFTPEELAQARAAAEEARRDFDKWIEQLQTPAAKAEAALLAQELAATWDAFVQDCAAGEVSHHKKAGPLSDRRAVLEYRGLRVLRWIERRGAVFYPGTLERETAKRYLQDMPMVFPELVGKLSAIYLYRQDEQATERLRKCDGILWKDATLDGFGTLYAIGISLEAIELGKEYVQLLFLHELCHIRVSGVHSLAFRQQLNRMIERFNQETGSRITNDYCP